jgi:uncharacterized caspase-like protein
MNAENNPNYKIRCSVYLIQVLVLCLTAIASPTKAAQKQGRIIPAVNHERVALVIGNAQYAVDSLKNPENDALAMAKALAGLGFEVDYFTNLNQQEMIQHIFDFYHHKAAKSSLRVVYYAGHGIQYEGRNYLIPVDANLALPAAIPQTSFMLDELRRGLDGLQQGASIVILDTCRVTVCPVKPCRGVMSSLGLSSERKSSGTLIAYSTGPGRPANDGGQTGHSLYTQVLIELVSTPGLPVEKLFRRLTEAVFQRSGGQQKPEFVDGLMGDEICFKTGPLGQCPLEEAQSQ